MSETLTEILQQLIANKTPKYRDLHRGLRAHYSPANEESSQFKLAWSRAEVQPSAREDEVLLRELKKALRATGREGVRFALTPNTELHQRKATILTWFEYIQPVLVPHQEFNDLF